MRIDAKVLLNRLGRSDFRYREFVDRFADLESWPVFEALLRDPRICAQSATDTDGSVQAPESPAASAGSLRPDLFARYGAAAAPQPAAEPPQSIRALLDRLSRAVTTGEI